jgi:hypothetical protein
VKFTPPPLWAFAGETAVPSRRPLTLSSTLTRRPPVRVQRTVSWFQPSRLTASVRPFPATTSSPVVSPGRSNVIRQLPSRPTTDSATVEKQPRSRLAAGLPPKAASTESCVAVKASLWSGPELVTIRQPPVISR